MSPEELGDMEMREFINKMVGFDALEIERRLWHAWVIASNNPYIKEKPGTFQQFCDRMKGTSKNNIPLTPDQFLRIIDAK